MKILISGGGIGGLTCAFWLQRFGFKPIVIEKAKDLRKEGYMIDFFGSGWDVVERMGLSQEVQRERYPIQNFAIVNDQGKPYFRISIEHVRKALNGRYTYLLRGDLEKILWDSVKDNVEIRFGNSVKQLESNSEGFSVTFEDGREENFDLVIGADGVHSKIRELLFGPEESFSQYLGYYVASFTVPNRYDIQKDMMLYQEPNHQVAFYPLDEATLAIAYLFKTPDLGFVPQNARKKKLEEVFRGTGWIAEKALCDFSPDALIFFDSLTQIRMPVWNQGRAVLIGDACGCLTLMAGQGASMAMAGAYIISREIKKDPKNISKAFQRYQDFLKPIISKKQKQAEKFSRNFIPGTPFKIKTRRIWTHLAMTRPFLSLTMRFFGAKSILKNFPNGC